MKSAGGRFAGATIDLKSRGTCKWVFAVAGSASLWAGAALAQQAADTQTTEQQGSGGLQEVVVTARYRSENLQQTPIAITALTNVDLEQRDRQSVV